MSSPGSSSRSIPFKSKKRLQMDSPISKPKAENTNNPPSSVALPTPEKPLENMLSRSRNRSVALSVKEIRQAAGSRRRSEDPVAPSSAKSKLFFSHTDSSSSKRVSKNTEKEKLPEKYEILGSFFDALDSSILLSKLRGSKPTFSNISGKIEHLTERRFCYSHLAQLKHILPEAMEIKRVLIHDERTCCMKPDLHVTLNADAVESNDDKSKSESKRISLRKVFRARLGEFVKAHPQGDDVPEEPLPELFNRGKPNENSRVEVKSVMEEKASIPAAKLFSSPFKVTSTPVKTASTPAKPTSSQINMAPTPSKTNSSPAKPTLSVIDMVPTPVKPVSTLANMPVTPATVDSTPVIAASTPPEFASTPARLKSTSLAARLQKRSSDCTNPDDVSADPPAKLVRRSLSLNFDSYPEDDKATDFTDDEPIDEEPEEDVSSDDEILSILPSKLRQAIKEQERKAIEDQNPAISLAKRRRKMIACLPKLFNVIHYLIQSIRRWVITKEELVHKIIAGHSDITDRKEVEEQLVLLQELVPEWMSEKKSSSGDVLVCINKLASPLTIRSRLEEVNKQEVAPLLS
ncbi:PREDICTED: CDT1-like protein a, chloroplastic [Camelina sativa]|uniref:CDT1-like protein a, chloroplastic n=1 Tax=Camelina sativa TaxID=90675 RepID=A0ABM0Z498_CAMSA|nr:PREDICTED: CDT1-like protein a, chloroplastic [Camelina sativa]